MALMKWLMGKLLLQQKGVNNRRFTFLMTQNIKNKPMVLVNHWLEEIPHNAVKHEGECVCINHL